VFVEQLDESLPDGPGSTENADWNFAGHDCRKLDFSIRGEAFSSQPSAFSPEY
jgi:hypothetical protein